MDLVEGTASALADVARPLSPPQGYEENYWWSCQDGVYRLVFAGSFVQLDHPGVLSMLPFSSLTKHPLHRIFTPHALRLMASNYASGRRYCVVTVQLLTTPLLHCGLMSPEELLAKGPIMLKLVDHLM